MWNKKIRKKSIRIKRRRLIGDFELKTNGGKVK